MPAYNPSPAHLQEALQSLLAQSFTDWEALIVDDASPNVDVRKTAEPFLKDSRFRLIRNAERLGIGGNWNACVAQTSAPFVAFLFHDDVWSPDYLQTAVSILEKNLTTGMVSMGHTYAFEGSETAKPTYDAVITARNALEPGLINGPEFLKRWTRSFFRPNVIGEPSFVVLRRSVMERVGKFDTGMQQNLDIEYWTRVLKVSDWYKVDGNSGSFRIHSTSASEQNRGRWKTKLERLKIFVRVVFA
jgi:glycosyltransferase involved in cell wall biosynthesis